MKNTTVGKLQVGDVMNYLGPKFERGIVLGVTHTQGAKPRTELIIEWHDGPLTFWLNSSVTCKRYKTRHAKVRKQHQVILHAKRRQRAA